ncbi:MAG: hypothetical protein ACKVS6_14480 [Planctomycetota bacterium]
MKTKALLLFIILSTLAAPLSAQHIDTRFGFRIDPPPNWKQLPIPTDQDWGSGRFQSDKFDIYIGPGTFNSEERKAEMLIMAFPSAAPAESKPADPKKGGPVDVKNPYKDYPDYFNNTYKEGARLGPAPKSTTTNGVKATVYSPEITSNNRSAPRKLLTWVFQTDGIDIAVQFDVLEIGYEKRAADIESSLKSFRIIPRSASAASGKAGKLTSDEMLKLTPEERKSRKLAIAEAAYAEAKRKLPEGWRAEHQGKFFILNHSDEKFSLKMTNHGDAVLAWLDKNFDFIGKGEFVRKPILRICKDSAESTAFGFGRWSFDPKVAKQPMQEIVVYKDEDDGSASPVWQGFNKSVLFHWIYERDPLIADNLPAWLALGLPAAFEKARVKDGILIFPPSVYELDELRELVRSGKVATARSLIYGLAGPGSYRNAEQAALARFFIAGRGAQDPKYKTTFKSYISNLKAAIVKSKKDPAPEEPERPEDGGRGNPLPELNTKYSKIADEAADKAFQLWRESDWKSLEQDYLDSLSIK